jgi:hypothetical protein
MSTGVDFLLVSVLSESCWCWTVDVEEAGIFSGARLREGGLFVEGVRKEYEMEEEYGSIYIMEFLGETAIILFERVPMLQRSVVALDLLHNLDIGTVGTFHSRSRLREWSYKAKHVRRSNTG